MTARKIIISLSLVLSLIICLPLYSGCGHKTQEAVTAAGEQAAAEVELPPLTQNLMYKTNGETPQQEPDYSFTDFSNELQPGSEDAVSEQLND